ncbi:ABC transporter ATP-binding protein [Abiotrophia defectiva]|uniref:ABC transporter, ATP-binding protein n=1 Tax=Abiotrophia defectiva ATCC 49176 TaxID=592010 RepID=W1Q6I2_ABIDE|nr:ABC transporter ATP-binding protein [Abiotrophia defectiva]ESK66334.1 ABC transporter, ATP-binding protein [Abiotrophia defectiva ATCC 49176]QKH47797.1 ABC transporter ATP-binding protein [Abiotrophia defectiva]
MLRDFFAYYKPYKKLFMIDFGCAVISAMLELTFPFVVNRVIDTILPTGHYQTVIWVCLLLLAFYLFNMVMKYIVVYLGHKLGITIETDMRRQLFQYFQRQSFEYFDNKQTGELMSRLTSDLFEIGELAHHGPEDLFITLMSLVGAFWLMLQVHVQLAIGTVILVPILGVALAIFNKKMGRINSQVYRQLGEFNAGLSNSLSGIRVVKAFANEAHEEARFEGLIQDYRENKLKFYQTMAASSAFNYVLMRIITLIALVSGAYFTLKGELTTGQLVGFVLLANTFVKPIESINIMIETYPKGFAGFKRFRQELAKPVAVQDLPGAQPAPHFQGQIDYRNVELAYEEGRTVISQLNLSIAPGESVALVGPSGAGKSSMVNLLPRFYDVTSGQVLIDGKDIREYTLSSLRQQIGIVQQDVFLFDGTIRENVLYGRLDASEAEVEEAIRAAKLDQVIAQLPDGLDTAIGERGVRLSGGQKQRLSIARIFLKNPSILILDEATSALDTQTEQYIQQSFDQLTKGRTSLIIAHRLATIQHVDRIVVVTEAGVVESGSHQELLALDGHYAALYRAQFA